MRRYWMNNLNWLERTPTSPYSLRNKLSEILYNSYTCKARVEEVNKETGEYRICIQGTLDFTPEENSPGYYRYRG